MNSSRRTGYDDIHGILLLNKHRGISSNSILQEVKHLLNVNKAGHTGTLDPMATGMLPICLGEATKFSQYLINSDKRYHVIACLGKSTDTFDSEGRIIKIRAVIFSKPELDRALKKVSGSTVQIPPMFSAIKHNGKPLYKYARQNIEVKRKSRSILVYDLICLRWEADELELEIHCSKGTYIRAIINDLGEQLGCGAHVTMLHRLQVANYPIDKMVTLKQLQTFIKKSDVRSISFLKLFKSVLLPIDSAIIDFPEVNLQSKHAIPFKNGQSIQITDRPINGIVRITEGTLRKFIGIATVDNKGQLIPKRLLQKYNSS